MRLVAIAVVLGCASSAVAQPQDLRPPDREIISPQAPVELPPLPSFELPPSEPGFVEVPHLRVTGRKHLDTDVRVKGYVIWIYDCVAAIAKRRESRAQTQRRIDQDPSLCERPKLYLGEEPKLPREKGLWVVSVPRPPNKLERKMLPPEELRAWPKVPKLKLGQYVVVSGRFALASPHGDRNSDGLVVFASIAPAKPRPAAKPPATTIAARPATAAPQIKQLVVKPRDDATRRRSIELAGTGDHALAKGFLRQAIAAYTKAIEEWPGNYSAFYGLGSVHASTGNWAAARDALLKAIELLPSDPMMNQRYGIALYESGVLDKALAHLAYATKLEPKLWRAHYYVGRIHRDRDESRWAAESFAAALRSGPPEPDPWVALGELYRRWGYADQALAVVTRGASIVTGAAAADVWYVVGMAHVDKRKNAEAIAAFTKALTARSDHHLALFMRGQSYFQSGDLANAKRDLEAFLQSPSNQQFAKQQAATMLLEIAGR